MIQKEARICHSALEHNLNFFRNKIQGKRLVACVKANAYGHGFYEVMPVLSKADACYVHSWDAAIRLRRDYPNIQIILAGYIGNEITLQHLAAENIDWVIFNFEQIKLLSNTKFEGSTMCVWLKIDTGMNRLGFSLSEAQLALAHLESSPFVNSIVLMTHLACASEFNHPKNRLQSDIFNEFTEQYPYHYTSIGSTAIALNQEITLGDYVRVGAGLYGLSPFGDINAQSLGLKPVMTLRAKIINIKQCMLGETVGYNAVWTCNKANTKIAVVAIGYGDGYSRSTKVGAPVYINSHKAAVVGIISMDTIIVELPDNANNIHVGDWAELWGENISVDVIAKYAGTIGYELVTMVGRRVKRTIVRNDM